MMKSSRLFCQNHIVILVVVLSGLMGGAVFAQNSSTRITFDDGVDGASLIPIGTEPMFHHREQVVYGVPEVTELSGMYPSQGYYRVFPSGDWDGEDVFSIVGLSNLRLDIWFGDPLDGGVRTVYSISNNGTKDLMAAAPVPGHVFKLGQLFVVGDRMIAYCAVYDEASARQSKIAFLSASLFDLKAGVEAPWEIHFVSAEYAPYANGSGGLWAIATPVFYEGAYWCVVTDYDSASVSVRTGGQCWILKIDSDGMPEGMVRIGTRSEGVAEHWHSGALLYDGSSYKAVWHHGDLIRRLMFREIGNIADYSDSATLDPGSGIDGLYQTQLASSAVWGEVVIAAGPDENSALTNSRWKNAFVLCQDPSDESKFLYGGDNSAGLIERVSIDEHGVAVSETVFNPVSKNTVSGPGQVIRNLSIFMTVQNGSRVAGIVSNEFGLAGARILQYTGVIQSDDLGESWGWVWRGTTEHGLSQNAGLAVLSNGRIILGSANNTSSVRAITPGKRIAGKPLFVGYRPVNMLGRAEDQLVIDDAFGQVVESAAPVKPLPAIVHSEQVFQLDRREELGGYPKIRAIDHGMLFDDLLDQNMTVAYWMRRKTPTSSGEADRMQVDTKLGIYSSGMIFGAGGQEYSPTLQGTSGDWVRVLHQYDSEYLSGQFPSELRDLNLHVKGQGSSSRASGNSELLLEYINIGHDRPALPYNTFDASGVSSGKFTGLSLGESWTVLVTMQIPEECWDSWSGNENHTWDEFVPLFTVSDAEDSSFVVVEANMAQSSYGVFNDAVFAWKISDSMESEPTPVNAHPMRTAPLIIALSKDGVGKLKYVIAGPHGLTSGARAMIEILSADTIRFSDIDETDSLEMYVLQIEAGCRALSLPELETMVSTLSFPESKGGPCSCGVDFNGDGELNFFDVSLFLQAFSANEPGADMNNDGSYNFFDVSLFLGAFSAGCP